MRIEAVGIRDSRDLPMIRPGSILQMENYVD